MVKNLVGPPVIGNDFIGRKKELASAWKALNDTNSLLMSSLRRVGYPEVMDLLMAEGYLIEENDEIHFRSPIIRDYWFRKYGEK